MTANRRNYLVTAGCLLAFAAAALPTAVSAAAEPAPALPYELASFSPDDGQPFPARATAVPDAESLTCMAKVVHHESRGQPRRGMVAVAQTLVNRMKAGGRFGGSICEVANQPGQYFKLAGYNPQPASSDWQQAMAVSRDTLSGQAEDVARGALFFHAGVRAPNGFFRSRARVAAIGGQSFYR